MDPALGELPSADVLIENGAISAVGPNLDAPGAEVIDATSMIVMPGFVDTHRHTWQTAVRHSYADVDPLQYFAEMLAPVGAAYRPEDVRIGTLPAPLSPLAPAIPPLAA